MALDLEIDQFSFQYAGRSTFALSGISLSVPAGTCCAILGPTGAGKSTLLFALAGVLKSHEPYGVYAGSIRIGTESYTSAPDHILFPVVGLCMQEPAVQISGLCETVHDEVLLTLENLGTEQTERASRVADALGALHIAHLTDRNPSALSGGEMQRVALATMLVASPQIMLFDEPATSLDSEAQSFLAQTIRSLRGRSTVLLCDASLDLAISTSDRIVVLDEGRMVFSGTRGDFLRRLDSFRTILSTKEWSESMSLLNEHIERGSSVARRIASKFGTP
ncbi:MAG: ABC transporter ATP-binding protein [Bacteroidota bacterium]